MVGRRLDRYIGFFFVWHFVFSLLAVVALYIIIDTFFKIEEFIGQESVGDFLSWIFTYHAYQVPPLLTQFLPLVTLLAGVISTTRLARYNELNAIKAVGVSLHRALAPLFACSVAVAALGAANQEFLVPSLAHDIVEVRMKMARKGVYHDLSMMDRANNMTVWVEELEYALPGFEVLGIEVKPQGVPAPGERGAGLRIRNGTAIWVDRWLFFSAGEALDPKGQWKPFEYRAVATREDATTFTLPNHVPPREPVRLEGERNGRPVAITFTAWKDMGALRLIRGGQLTAPPGVEGGSPSPAAAAAPIAIQAALWRDDTRQWLGRANTYRVRESRRDEIVYDGEPLPFAIPPGDLIKTSADPTLKGFRDLLRYGREVPAQRQKALVILHSRLAFPLASVVLLLVAVPLLFQQEGGKSTWVGLGLGLLVSMGFYFVNYVSQLAGVQSSGLFAGSPALAAWLPIVLFGALGAALMARMET